MKTLLRNQRVRRLPAVIALCASLALPLPALAWDGFDADSADLVEIIPDALPNKGVIVACEASHLCMKMRGVEKQESTTFTMHYKGAFEDVRLRQEFFELLHQQK